MQTDPSFGYNVITSAAMKPLKTERLTTMAYTRGDDYFSKLPVKTIGGVQFRVQSPRHLITMCGKYQIMAERSNKNLLVRGKMWDVVVAENNGDWYKQIDVEYPANEKPAEWINTHIASAYEKKFAVEQLKAIMAGDMEAAHEAWKRGGEAWLAKMRAKAEARR